MRSGRCRSAFAGMVALALAPGLGCRDDDTLPGRDDTLPDRSDGALPQLDAARAPAGAITVDGELVEKAWERAGVTGPFVHPTSGRPDPDSPVAARAWITWDREHLYVAAVVEDDDPTSPFGPDDENPHIWTRSSGFELMIQPGDPGDNRHYYEVQVDIAGAVWDTRFDDYNEPITRDRDGNRRFGHEAWSSDVRAGVSIDEDQGHYTLELAIPWSAFESSRAAVPPRPGDVWRINLYSFRDGQRAALAWSPLLGEGNFHRTSRFGRVRFVASR